jgi:hypothetical protein
MVISAEAVALLCAIIADVPSLPHAACKNLAPSFDGGSTTLPMQVCRHCDERIACARFAATPHMHPLHGVYSGRLYVNHGETSFTLPRTSEAAAPSVGA